MGHGPLVEYNWVSDQTCSKLGDGQSWAGVSKKDETQGQSDFAEVLEMWLGRQSEQAILSGTQSQMESGQGISHCGLWDLLR